MEKFITKQLEIAQKEVNKRLKINSSLGIDLANYENGFIRIFENMIVNYFISIGCENSNKPYESLTDQLSFWLWEKNYEIIFPSEQDWIDGEITKGKGYKVSLKKPKDFYNYIVNTYMKKDKNE